MPLADLVLLGSTSTLLIASLTFVLMAAAAFVVIAPLPETPASRLVRYTAALRQGSPGAYVDTLGPGERLLSPVTRRLMALAASTAPPRVRRQTAARLVMAGVRTGPTTFLAARMVLFLGLPLLVLTYLLRSGPITPTGWLLLALSVLLGRRLPDTWLKRKIRARQRAIDRGLPYALDLMVACIEGGLSLDASLAKVAEQSEGPLAAEIGFTLQEMSLGRPAADAMRAMGERAGAPDLKRFTSSVVQAERMGVPIAEAMRTLAQESRVRRRQRAEEMARKAPIKMIPVLIFCILPALVVVIMAPAGLILMRMFSRGGP